MCKPCAHVELERLLRMALYDIIVLIERKEWCANAGIEKSNEKNYRTE